MTVKFGILGTSKIARAQLIPSMKLAGGCEPYAVASRDSAKAAEFAKEQGVARSHGSYEALLADPEVDAVYIPLPNSLHEEWCLRCAEAGKPVLCEKPISVDAASARRIFDAFAARDLLVCEGFMYRFHPLHQSVKNLINAGSIGELRAIHSTFHVSLPVTDIRYSAQLRGGALLDLGCYCVGISRLLAETEPVSHSARARFRDGVDIAFAGSMGFPGDVLATFSCSLDTRFDCRYEVYGSEGRIFVERGAMVAWPGEAFVIKVWSGDAPVEEVVVPEANAYQHMLEAFAHSFRTDGPSRVPPSESIANLTALDALMKSARQL